MKPYATATITSKYQITIPSAVRRLIGDVEPGEKIEFYVNKNHDIKIKFEREIDEILSELPKKHTGKNFTDIRKETYKKRK